MKRLLLFLMLFASLSALSQNKVNLATQVKGTLPVTNAGTGIISTSTHQVLVTTATNTYTLKTVPDCQDSGGNHLNFTQSGDSITCGTSLGSSSATVQIHRTNDGAGTTNNLLVYDTGTTVKTFTTNGGVNRALLGIVSSGAGTSGTALITVLGPENCQFDGATTKNDFVVPSTTSAGKCHDNGSALPACSSNNYPIGVVQSTNGTSGTYSMDVLPQMCTGGGDDNGVIPLYNQYANHMSASSLWQDGMTIGSNVYLMNGATLLFASAAGAPADNYGRITPNTTTSGPELRSAGGGGGPIYLSSGISAGVESNNRTGTFNLPTGNGGVKEYTLTGNVTINYDSKIIAGTIFWLDLCQDGTGGRTVTWNANVQNAPTVDTAANACTVVQLVYVSSSKQIVVGSSGYTSTVSTNSTNRVCVFDNDTQSATALTDAQITGRCVVPANATLLEIDVIGSGGTPQATLERYRPNGGTTADLQSGALATGSSGAFACARSATSATCIGGSTSSSSITTSNTTLKAGDFIRIKTATAGGTATYFTIVAIYTVTS